MPTRFKLSGDGILLAHGPLDRADFETRSAPANEVWLDVHPDHVDLAPHHFRWNGGEGCFDPLVEPADLAADHPAPSAAAAFVALAEKVEGQGVGLPDATRDFVSYWKNTVDGRNWSRDGEGRLK